MKKDPFPYYIFPRVGWFELSEAVAKEIERETGLDSRRNLHGFGVRWLDWEVLFSVKETGWNEEMLGDIMRAAQFWDSLPEADRPKQEPEVKPKRKRKTK